MSAALQEMERNFVKMVRPVQNEFNQGPLTLDEMMKIVSLLENPPEAAMVRKALRFYEIPKTLTPKDYKWGENAGLAEAMQHFSCPQNPEELGWMLEHIKGKNSLLEVGSSFGGTLKRMASVMNKGAHIVSVDYPCDSTPKCLNPLDSLKDTCRKLSLLGANVNLIIGDSHDAEVVAAVRELAPFEFGFIDGDHSYEGVKLDWQNYGPLCKTVAFHDIGGPVEGCKRFWHELKATGQYRVEECTSHKNPKFGIGIVYREA
jgi:hypothetical protein